MENENRMTGRLVDGRVSARALREMTAGECVVFRVPDNAAVYSGKAIVQRMRRVLGRPYRTQADYRLNTLTVIYDND